MSTLLREVENFPSITIQSDTLRWRHSGDGIFFVNEMYKKDNGVI